MRSLHRNRTIRAFQTILLVSVFLVGSRGWAQQAAEPPLDKPTLQLLLAKISELEARVAQLEAGKLEARTVGLASIPNRTSLPIEPHVESKSMVPDHASSTPPAKSEQVPVAPKEAEPPQTDSAMAERMDLSRTLLRIRGFGDVSLHGDNQKGDTTSFSLGQLDLFITSDMSDRFKFLSEIVFESGPHNYYGSVQGQENTFGVDIERYLVQYSYNDYFNLSVGRVHTAIGYYNTAYHHSSWLQTTTDRPQLFSFEDDGGILPVHTVGASAAGAIPSGSLGLHYVAEVGNGRESRTPLTSQPVQNAISDLNHKAFNLALFARPDAVRGLQTGFSVYHDLLAPANAPTVGETILAAHAILIRPKYEWLSEAVLDRHTVNGTGQAFNTPAFYTLVSRQLGSFRPYLRYQYINAGKNEPIFPDVGLSYGPSLGLRYDASESVAVKFQYDHYSMRDQPAISGLNLQLGYTF